MNGTLDEGLPSASSVGANGFLSFSLKVLSLTALHDSVGGVHAGHMPDIAKTHQKPHTGAVTTAQIHSIAALSDTSQASEIHRRAQPTDMDLLSHHKLPQIALPAGVDRLDVHKANSRKRLHGRPPFPVVSVCRNDLFTHKPCQ